MKNKHPQPGEHKIYKMSISWKMASNSVSPRPHSLTLNLVRTQSHQTHYTHSFNPHALNRLRIRPYSEQFVCDLWLPARQQVSAMYNSIYCVTNAVSPMPGTARAPSDCP